MTSKKFWTALAGFAVAASANASIVTFDEYPHSLSAFGDGNTANGFVPASSGAYKFTSSWDSFYIIPSSNFGITGNSGTNILYENSDAVITMRAGDGGTFNLSSLMYGTAGSYPTATLVVTGFVHGGGSVSTIFTGLGYAMASATFTGFTNLDYVTFDSIGVRGSFALDNINVTAAVPTPPVLPLFGLGLAAMFAVRRRKA